MTDHEWRQVRVTFRKAVSDGSYGTESAEVTLEDWIDALVTNNAYQTAVRVLLDEARELVHAELRSSHAPRVRESVSRIRTYAAGPDDDGEE